MKRLYVIGMGPGGAEQLTPQALRALEDSQVLCCWFYSICNCWNMCD